MTWEQLTQFLEAVVTIFAIVNPIGNLPLLAGLTEEASDAQRKRVFRLAALVAFVIVSVFALAGHWLMRDVFHIGLHEFAFGGGLLLVVIGMRNILGVGRTRNAEGPEPPGGASQPSPEVALAVTPIAFPLLAGPGTIVTVMLMVDRSRQVAGAAGGTLYGLAASAAAFALVLLVLHYSAAMLRLMGKVVTLAVGRVLQIFIVAIGVHFIFQAIRQTFPALTR